MLGDLPSFAPKRAVPSFDYDDIVEEPGSAEKAPKEKKKKSKDSKKKSKDKKRSKSREREKRPDARSADLSELPGMRTKPRADEAAAAAAADGPGSNSDSMKMESFSAGAESPGPAALDSPDTARYARGFMTTSQPRRPPRRPPSMWA